MRKMGLFPPGKPKNTYKPKPYEQMTHPGQRVQVDVKVVPRKCIADPELPVPVGYGKMQSACALVSTTRTRAMSLPRTPAAPCSRAA